MTKSPLWRPPRRARSAPGGARAPAGWAGGRRGPARRRKALRCAAGSRSAGDARRPEASASGGSSARRAPPRPPSPSAGHSPVQARASLLVGRWSASLTRATITRVAAAAIHVPAIQSCEVTAAAAADATLAIVRVRMLSGAAPRAHSRAKAKPSGSHASDPGPGRGPLGPGRRPAPAGPRCARPGRGVRASPGWAGWVLGPAAGRGLSLSLVYVQRRQAPWTSPSRPDAARRVGAGRLAAGGPLA